MTDAPQPSARPALLLLVCAAVAVAWASSPWSGGYRELWTTDVGPTDLHHVVDEGLMALFFLSLGIELRHEALRGRLSSARDLVLPGIGALGGMVVPALLYLAIASGGRGGAGHGWGIPVATDVAFALGVLALVGPRIPSGLRVLLLTLAVLDDIGGILIITVAYSHGFDGRTLSVAAVAVGLLVPLAPRWERRVEGATVFVVLPLFALANAGIAVSGHALGDVVTSRVGLGVIVGLVIGKAVGISGAMALAARLGWAPLPDGVRSSHLVGLGLLGGIGFTVSIFVTGLAFDDAALRERATLGILVASLLAAALGTAVLRWGHARRPAPQ
jgi:NhaA family Na+:H+ antiporter